MEIQSAIGISKHSQGRLLKDKISQGFHQAERSGREFQANGKTCQKAYWWESPRNIFNSVQSLSRVWHFATPWTAACQASLSITSSQGLLKLMSIESVIPSNHLILCYSLLLPPSISVWGSYPSWKRRLAIKLVPGVHKLRDIQLQAQKKTAVSPRCFLYLWLTSPVM